MNKCDDCLNFQSADMNVNRLDGLDDFEDNNPINKVFVNVEWIQIWSVVWENLLTFLYNKSEMLYDAEYACADALIIWSEFRYRR